MQVCHAGFNLACTRACANAVVDTRSTLARAARCARTQITPRFCRAQAGVGAGGLLTLDLHPGFSHGKPWLLAGSMDGSVSVLDATSGTLLGTAKPHTKYVVKATWARGGDVIVSASYDQSVRLLSVRPAGDGDAVKLEETQVRRLAERQLRQRSAESAA